MKAERQKFAEARNAARRPLRSDHGDGRVRTPGGPGWKRRDRFHTDEDDDRAQHIVRDFEPTFQKLASLGFEQVWEDDWLWGHKAFQRTHGGAGL